MDARVWGIITEAFGKVLISGIQVTIPMTILAFAFGLLIAVIVALIQYGKVPVLKEICRFYIWLIRGTPLLVQLYIIFYGLPALGLRVDPFWTAVVELPHHRWEDSASVKSDVMLPLLAPRRRVFAYSHVLK